MLSIRRAAPASLALAILLSGTFATAAPAREGMFKSLRVGFKAFREHRVAQGPGIIRRTLTGAKNLAIGGALIVADGAVRGAKGMARMTVAASDTARALGRVVVVKPAKAVVSKMIIRPAKAFARAVGAEKASIREGRADNRMAKQIAGTALTEAEIGRMAAGGQPRATKVVNAALARRAAAPMKDERPVEYRAEKHALKVEAKEAKTAAFIERTAKSQIDEAGLDKMVASGRITPAVRQAIDKARYGMFDEGAAN